MVSLGACGQGASDSDVLDAAQLGVAPAAQPRLTVNPPDGAAGVSPAEKVTAAVIGGQLTQVQLTAADGTPLPGALSPDGERWSSVNPLKPATAYTLRAGSRAPSGEETTTTTRFRTLVPGQDVTGKITPENGGPVAVNQIVSVLFDKPIANRAAVEKSLRVTSNPAVTGNVQWRSDRELLWQPAPGWSPGSQVTVCLDIYGKQLGSGLVGASDLRTTFAVVDDGDGDGLALRSQSSGASSSSAPRAPVRSSPPARAAAPAVPVKPSTALRSSRPSAPAGASTSTKPAAKPAAKPATRPSTKPSTSASSSSSEGGADEGTR
jgi:hypothetical protein